MSLKVYDVRGQVVATLVDEEIPAGMYERSFNAQGLASGAHFYRPTAPGVHAESRKMQLLK